MAAQPLDGVGLPGRLDRRGVEHLRGRVTDAVAQIHDQIGELLDSIAALSSMPEGAEGAVSMGVVRQVEAGVSRARNRLESARLRLGAVAAWTGRLRPGTRRWPRAWAIPSPPHVH